MKKVRVLFIIWAILVVIIFGLLITLGFIYKGKLKEYKDYEIIIKEATLKYINDEHLSMDGKSQLTINIDELIEKGFIKKKEVVDSCSGKVTIKYNETFDIYPIIKCKYYSTKKN